MRKICLFLMCMASALSAFSQNRKVEGKVTEQGTGDPLVGVSVLVKGTTSRTSTDNNGHYVVQIPAKEKAAVLVFTYVGYLRKDVAVGDKTVINTTLVADNNALDDVVVVGYGTTKKKDLTGSVSSVNMKDLTQAPVRSIDEALGGRVAGVQVVSTDGQPGASSTIRIRGANSVTQSNDPLYIVDGFPVEGFDLNTVSPDEIESVNVLKDASATAIYGARAANGVIVIETKKGKAGNPVLTFNTSHILSNNTKRIDLLSPLEYVQYQLERNPLKPTTGSTPYSLYVQRKIGVDADGKDILLNESNYEDYYRNYQAADWQKPFNQTGYQQNYDLAIRGGSERTTFALSTNMNKQTGTIINTGYDRYQGRIVLEHKVNNKLKVGINTSYAATKKFGNDSNTGLSGGGAATYLLYSVWGYSPLTPVNDEAIDPEVALLNGINDYRFNPVTNQNNIVNNNKATNFNVNSYAEYNILPELKLRVTGILTSIDESTEKFYNSQTQNGSPVGWNKANGVNGSIFWRKSFNWANENTLTWKKTFGKHSVTVLAGVTEQANKYQTFGYSAKLLPNESLGLSGLDEGTLNPVANATSANWSYASVLSRVSYGYADRYLIDLSYRGDGSSKFAEQNHWGYFPSVGAAWRFSQESFLKDFKALSDGKLRLSYGQTGNNRIDEYLFMSRLNLLTNASYSWNNSYVQPLSPATNLSNPNLKWETTEQYNVGLDLSFLKNRIGLVADWYTKNTRDLLLNAQIPASSGYPTSLINVGSVKNTGLELTLNTINIDHKDFRWTSSFNIAFNKNTLVSLASGQESLLSGVMWDNAFGPQPGYIAKVGESLGMMYGWIWDGNYQYNDFDKLSDGTYLLKDNVTGNGKPRNQIQPGDIKYRDLNGDNTIDIKDRTVIGRSLPIHTGGFTNNFRYKAFDLNVFLQWSYGNDIQNVNRMVFEGNVIGRTGLEQFASYADRWSPTNQDSQNFRALGYTGTGYSSRTIEDGSFIRLKTVSIGYSLPKALLNRIGITAARFSLSGQNLLTLTNYSGLDPEVSTQRSVLTGGFDYSAYPRARVFSIGANVTF